MGQSAIIIAEAGVNHNGDMPLAKELIDAAAEAGADYVKFQSFKAEKHASRNARKADYQLATNAGTDDDGQFEMLRKLELSEADHLELMSYCQSAGIKFLSSAFDPEGVDYLCSLGLDTIKVPSGELINLPYLRKAGQSGKQVWLSCGMGTLGEIDAAVNVVLDQGLEREKLILLHCNTEYPTPFEDANLKVVSTLRSTFNLEVGYSDHTMGIEAPIAAVALGAVLIEKHLTLNREMEGPDHKASLEPEELKSMVASIRNVELALGDGYKRRTPSETRNLIAARKSIHLKTGLAEGDPVTEDGVMMLRPGDGICPMELDNLVGRKASRDLSEGHRLSWADVV
jgi:N-acetylneuraminate synthase/N,N'-diacetyllegionaminate synthase